MVQYKNSIHTILPKFQIALKVRQIIPMSPNFIKQTTYHNSLTKPNLQVSGHPKAKLYKTKSPTIAKRYN